MVFLCCNFCGLQTVTEDLHAHQSRCQSDLDMLRHLQPGKSNGPFSDVNQFTVNGRSNLKLPCQFCEVLIVLKELMCHQIICNKKYSKKVLKNYKLNAVGKINTKSNILCGNTKALQDTSFTVNRSLSYSDRFFKELSKTLNLKRSFENSKFIISWSCYSDMSQADFSTPIVSQTDVLGNSKICVVPTLVLRQPKLTDDQINQSLTPVKKDGFLSRKCNTKIYDNSTVKPFLNTRKTTKTREAFHKYKTLFPGKNVSYSEQNEIFT